jgi:hypothetical protein
VSTPVYQPGDGVRLIWIDAVSSTEAYAIDEIAGAILHLVVSQSGTTDVALPSLPNGDVPAQVTAAPDGTLWSRARSGSIYAFASASNPWSSIDTASSAIATISVGSASNILATTSSGQVLRYTAGAGFQAEAGLAGTAFQAVEATPDGAGWAYADGELVIKPLYGVWKLEPAAAQPSSITPLAGLEPFFDAGSMNRAFIVGTTSTSDPYENLQIALIDFGVVDRQAIPFVA